MSTVTLEIPETLAARLRTYPDADRFASDAIIDALQREAVSSAFRRPLRPFAEYSSEAGYVAAAAESAPAFGVDSDLAASLAAGHADAERGRTLSLDEAKAEWAAGRAAWRQRRSADGDE